MIGGPTGFDGAERYQYGPDTPEGRAIEAVKALRGAGKAPDRIVLGLSDGSIGQITQPFPTGAPSIKDLWEQETGIELDIVGVPNGQEFTKVMQDISTKTGEFDIYAVEWNRLGDLAETGGIVNLDDFVTAHRPEWDDPKRGYVGGEQGVSLLNSYRGSVYGVCLDGDFPDLEPPHRSVQRRSGEGGFCRPPWLRTGATENLEGARRDRGILPSSG